MHTFLTIIYIKVTETCFSYLQDQHQAVHIWSLPIKQSTIEHSCSFLSCTLCGRSEYDIYTEPWETDVNTQWYGTNNSVNIQFTIYIFWCCLVHKYVMSIISDDDPIGIEVCYFNTHKNKTLCI